MPKIPQIPFIFFEDLPLTTLQMLNRSLIRLLVNTPTATSPRVQEVRNNLDRAIRELTKPPKAKRPAAKPTVQPSTRTPLLDWAGLCPIATAASVKAQPRLRAKARPSRVTAAARPGKRSAIQSKAKTKQRTK